MPLSPDRLLLEETPGGARLNLRSLDELGAERARPHLLGLARSRPGRNLHLDLGRLEYLSSTGLGLLVALHHQVRAAGGRLSLLNVAAPVYEVFSVTRLTSLLDVRQGHEVDASLSIRPTPKHLRQLVTSRCETLHQCFSASADSQRMARASSSVTRRDGLAEG